MVKNPANIVDWEITVTFTENRVFTMRALAEKQAILETNSTLATGTDPSNWYLEKQTGFAGY
jgi:hypothetical protein